MTEEELARLEAEARYADERFRLYRARVQSSRRGNPSRLRKLEQTSQLAQTRLRRAHTVPENN